MGVLTNSIGNLPAHHGQKDDADVKKLAGVKELTPCRSGKARMDSERPELVAFMEELDYQFVDIIFQDEKMMPFIDRDIDHKIISRVLSSGDRESGNGVSNEPEPKIDDDSHGTDSSDEMIVLERQQVDKKKVPSREAAVADSAAPYDDINNGYSNETSSESEESGSINPTNCQEEVVVANSVVPPDDINNNYSNETSSESEEESGSLNTTNSQEGAVAANPVVPPDDINNSYSIETFSKSEEESGSISTTNSQEELQCSPDSETKITSKPVGDDEMSQCLRVPGHQSIVRPHDQGEIVAHNNSTLCVEQVSCSASNSRRSSCSSATSSHSFAFPVLPSEWDGSPLRLAKDDRKERRKQKTRRMWFFCCKF